MVGSLIIGEKNDLPLKMIRCMSLERETHGHAEYDGTNMCSRRCVFLVINITTAWLMYIENGSTW